MKRMLFFILFSVCLIRTGFSQVDNMENEDNGLLSRIIYHEKVAIKMIIKEKFEDELDQIRS